MAFRVDKCVVRGWIDNREQGLTTGEIWLSGLEHPLQLRLKGNCLSDVAGHRLAFENPEPEPQEQAAVLTSLQRGQVGDVTASRKVRVLDESGEGDDRIRWANSLYLEWFSENNGRVVIESASFQLTLTEEPTWQMSKDDEQRQRAANAEAMGQFLNQPFESDGWQPEEGGLPPTDEFEWEQILRESDKRGEKHMELMERYEDHPDRERLIAREMGWDHLEDLMDADERGLFKDLEPIDYDVDPLEPNPLTEGRDWIRNDFGDPVHPLQHRATELALFVYRIDRSELSEETGRAIMDFRGRVSLIAAKLAGALNGLAYEERTTDWGFVVASLKRVLGYHNEALAGYREAINGKALSDEDARFLQTELFAIREEILRLMDDCRSRIR